MSASCVQCRGDIPPGDAHASCMHCLGLAHAVDAVRRPNGCLYCSVFSERLRGARLSAMRTWVTQALAPAEADRPLPPSGVVSQHRNAPAHSSGGLGEQAGDQQVDADPEDDILSVVASDGLLLGDDAGSVSRRSGQSAGPSEWGSDRPDPAPAMPKGVQDLLNRVTVALGIAQEGAQEGTSDSPPVVPIFSAFKEAILEGWADRRGRFHFTADSGPWAFMAEPDSLGLRQYPTMDSMIAAMVLPDKDIIGKTPRLKAGPSRTVDDDLRMVYTSLTVAGRLSNAVMLLQTYLKGLVPQVTGEEGPVTQEVTLVSGLIGQLQRDMAQANGKALAQVVTARRHLWLSQTKLPAAMQSTFSDLPLTPGITFGPGVDEILRQTDQVRKDRETLRHFMPPPQYSGPPFRSGRGGRGGSRQSKRTAEPLLGRQPQAAPPNPAQRSVGFGKEKDRRRDWRYESKRSRRAPPRGGGGPQQSS